MTDEQDGTVESTTVNDTAALWAQPNEPEGALEPRSVTIDAAMERWSHHIMDQGDPVDVDGGWDRLRRALDEDRRAKASRDEERKTQYKRQKRRLHLSTLFWELLICTLTVMAITAFYSTLLAAVIMMAILLSFSIAVAFDNLDTRKHSRNTTRAREGVNEESDTTLEEERLNFLARKSASQDRLSIDNSIHEEVHRLNHRKWMIETGLTTLDDATGIGKNLRDRKFNGLDSVRMPGADLSKVNLLDMNLIGADLSRSNLEGNTLRCANLFGANLSGADLFNVDLTRAELTGANLTSAKLSCAVLMGAKLPGACLNSAELAGTNLSSSILSEADLSFANLSGAILSGADLSSADLSGADLSGAYLTGAHLHSANLRSVRMKRANLRGAYLYRADLTDADLSNANLQHANFAHAVLVGTNLSGAKFDCLDNLCDVIWSVGTDWGKLYPEVAGKSIPLGQGHFRLNPPEIPTEKYSPVPTVPTVPINN